MSLEKEAGGTAFVIGQLVWAKLKGYPFWPAKVSDPNENPTIKRSRRKNSVFVRFFGSGDFSFISIDEIRPYFAFKEKLSQSSKKGPFIQACREVDSYVILHPTIKEYEATLNFTDDDGYREWLKETKDDDNGSDYSEEVLNEPPPSKPAIKQKLTLSSNFPAKRQKLDSQRSSMTKSSRVSSTNGIGEMSITSKSLSSLPIGRLEGVLADKTVGFIGLGTIGSILAKCLLSNQVKLVMCTRSPKNQEEFEPGRFVEWPVDLLDECDIIFSCVSDNKAVRQVMFGEHGLAEKIGPGKMYIELSTVDLVTSIEVYDVITSRGGRYLEAPMSGTLIDAREGKMIFLCGGDRKLFDEMLPLFQILGRRAIYTGPSPGSGMKFRLCLQMLNGIIVAGVAETLALSDRCGLNINDVQDIIELTSANCALVKNTIREIIEGVYMPAEFQLDLMQKEVQHAVTLANGHLSQPTLLGTMASHLFMLARNRGEEKSDCAAVYRAITENSSK